MIRDFAIRLCHHVARNSTGEIIDLVRIIRVIGLCGEGDCPVNLRRLTL